MEELFTKYFNYLVAERDFSPHTITNYKRDIMRFHKFLSSRGSGKPEILWRSVDRSQIVHVEPIAITVEPRVTARDRRSADHHVTGCIPSQEHFVLPGQPDFSPRVWSGEDFKECHVLPRNGLFFVAGLVERSVEFSCLHYRVGIFPRE